MEMNSNPTLSVFKNYTTIFLSIGKKIVLYLQIKEKNVTVHSIAVNSNVSRHLKSPLAMGEIHSRQYVHPHS